MMNNFKTNRLASLQRLAAVPLVLLILLWPAQTALCQDAPVSFPGSTAQPLPAGWQQSIASLEEPYPAIQGDTVITRTCGTSLSVSCVRYTEDNKSHYTFVVRERDSVQRCRTFQALGETVDTMRNYQGHYIEYHTRFYIKDMRTADSMCFFCGMREDIVTLLPLSSGEAGTAPAERVLLSADSMGLLGRFSLAKIVTPVPISEAPQGPETRGDESGTVEPQGILPTRVGIRILPIEETSVLDKMWIDEGLNVDYSLVNGSCPNDPPFSYNEVYYDPGFPPDSVQAFIVGRLKDNASRSCVVNVKGLLLAQSEYTLKKSPLIEEIFYDVTGIDARVILSSRIDSPQEKTSIINYTSFPSQQTIGLRVKDLYRNQVHYHEVNNVTIYTPWSPSEYNQFEKLHLYNMSCNLDIDPINEKHGRNYGHLCRMKNHHSIAISQGVTYGEYYENQDFCMVVGLNRGIGIVHIDKEMNPIYCFPTDHDYRRKNVSDVVCIGNTLYNSIAIAHYDSTNVVDLVDWGNSVYGWFIYNYPPSVKLSLLNMDVTSLDIYFNGSTLLAGGLKNNAMIQAVQRKNAWTSNWYGYSSNLNDQPGYHTCFNKVPLAVGTGFSVSNHDFYMLDLDVIANRTLTWPLPSYMNIDDPEPITTCTKTTNSNN